MNAFQYRPLMAQKLAQDFACVHDARAASMQAGPRFLDDGVTLFVPSEPGWFRPQAVRFWKDQGFSWTPDQRMWTRDVRQPWHGKQYRPEIWLKSIRRKFYELYPELQS